MSAESFKAAGFKDVDKLFTKDGHLKKAVGQACKGWKLERVKSSTTEDPSKAFLDAKHRFGQMILESDTTTATDHFVFSRRTPCKCLESIFASVGSETLRKFSDVSSFLLI